MKNINLILFCLFACFVDLLYFKELKLFKKKVQNKLEKKSLKENTFSANTYHITENLDDTEDEEESRKYKIKNSQFLIFLDANDMKLLKRGKLIHSIQYNEILFVEGKILFHFHETKTIKTKQYRDIIHKLIPPLYHFILRKHENNKEYIDKYCLLFISQYNWLKNFNTNKIDLNLSSLCLDEEYEVQKINEFLYKFLYVYSKSIFNEKNLVRLQNYPLNEIINYKQIKYFTTDYSFNLDNFMQYYILLNSEGVVLNSKKSKNPLSTTFSFRYDQMIDCENVDISTVEVPFYLANKDCCIAYKIDWAHRPIVDIFCSGYQDSKYCKIDIKILQATISKQCYLKSLHILLNMIRTKEKINKLKISSWLKDKYLKLLAEFNKLISVYFPNLSGNFPKNFLNGLFDDKEDNENNEKIKPISNLNKHNYSKSIENKNQTIRINIHNYSNTRFYPNNTLNAIYNVKEVSQFEYYNLEIKFIEYLQTLHQGIYLDQETIFRLSSFTSEHDELINSIIKEFIFIPREIVDNFYRIPNKVLKFILEELLKKNKINFKLLIKNYSNFCNSSNSDDEEEKIEEIEIEIKNKTSIIEDKEDITLNNNTITLISDKTTSSYNFEDDFNQIGKECNSTTTSLVNPKNIGIDPYKVINVQNDIFIPITKKNETSLFPYTPIDYNFEDDSIINLNNLTNITNDNGLEVGEDDIITPNIKQNISKSDVFKDDENNKNKSIFFPLNKACVNHTLLTIDKDKVKYIHVDYQDKYLDNIIKKIRCLLKNSEIIKGRIKGEIKNCTNNNSFPSSNPNPSGITPIIPSPSPSVDIIPEPSNEPKQNPQTNIPTTPQPSPSPPPDSKPKSPPHSKPDITPKPSSPPFAEPKPTPSLPPKPSKPISPNTTPEKNSQDKPIPKTDIVPKDPRPLEPTTPKDNSKSNKDTKLRIKKKKKLSLLLTVNKQNDINNRPKHDGIIGKQNLLGEQAEIFQKAFEIISKSDICEQQSLKRARNLMGKRRKKKKNFLKK